MEQVGIYQCSLVIDPPVLIRVRHISNYCKFQLSSDIEKIPGPTPMYIDPNKTKTAPYSQVNELVFGQNSGQQCVAMSHTL